MSSNPTILQAVRDCLLRHGASGKRICAGLSGGRDSVVLLDLLHRLRASMDLQLSAVHVHHGLSANADAWAAFCQQYCDRFAVPMQRINVQVDRNAGGGIEANARAARYAAFQSVDADFLAVAQHADDQAETVLHQLLRGTGWKGLAGMGEQRALNPGLQLIRPLLTVTREEIEQHADASGLDWIDDESNDDRAFTRNFIRHELIPPIAARFPHYRESLIRAGRHAAEADEMLAALAAIDLQWDGREATVDRLDALPPSRQVNALYHWLQWQDLGDAVFPSQLQLTEWAQQLFRATPTDRPHQAGGHDFVIRRRKNRLSLERK
ncbi:MAG: tRNA lysidine(34) synthetase TilS [Betaproteobacteria bacterium]|nr:tRNA lysidine(34) synthetase TilS [Betaproteobacteria bacterium]